MTSSLSPTLQAERRSWHYWFVDGLPSILTGAVFLLLAFFFFYERRTSHSPISFVMVFTALFLWGAITLRQREILDWRKAKITYPRTGYATPPPFTEGGLAPLELTMLSLQGSSTTPSEQAKRSYAERKRRLW